MSKLSSPPTSHAALRFEWTFQKMINEIRQCNNHSQIIISAIIPRVWDDDRRRPELELYNGILKKFNSQSNVYHIPTHKPFLKASGAIKANLFLEDGLHLSESGYVVLRSYFCDKLNKAENNVLK